MKGITTVVVFVVFVALANAATDKLICYYGSWAQYRQGEGHVTVDDLNEADECTHIIYNFVDLTGEGKIDILNPEEDSEALKKLTQFKKSNPNKKVMIAVGGWEEDPLNFSKVASDRNLREEFVKNVVQFIKDKNLDGIDLHWNYLASGDGSRSEDKQNFIVLIKELREKFETNGWLLSAAVNATKQHRVRSYDVKNMNQYLDFINVMAFDLHDYTRGKTGFHTPLYAAPSEEGQELNVYDIMQDWIKDGAKPEKLIMGLAFFGRGMTLSNINNNDIGAPTSGPSSEGDYTEEEGSLSYLEICKNIQNKNKTYKRVFDDKRKVPYIYNGNQWIGYDDVESLKLKVEAAKELNLGGVMMWTAELDDTKNICGSGKFPLLRAINEALKNDISSTTSSTNNSSVTSSTQSSVMDDTNSKSTTKITTESSSNPSSSTVDNESSNSTSSDSDSTQESTEVNPELTSTSSLSTLDNESNSSTSSGTTSATTQSDQQSSSTVSSTISTQTSSSNLPATSTPVSTITNSPVNPSSYCVREEYIIDRKDCSVFYYCRFNPHRDEYEALKFNCPGNLLYDQKMFRCEYPRTVDCTPITGKLQETNNNHHYDSGHYQSEYHNHNHHYQKHHNHNHHYQKHHNHNRYHHNQNHYNHNHKLSAKNI